MSRRILIRLSELADPVVPVRVFWLGKMTSEALSLLVDTGAFDLALSENDARKLRAKLSELSPLRMSLSGIGGAVHAFEMKDVAILFTCEDGSAWMTDPGPIHVLSHRTEKGTRQMQPAAPSLLGRRFMERHRLILHWDFGTRQAYLEVPD